MAAPASIGFSSPAAAIGMAMMLEGHLSSGDRAGLVQHDRVDPAGHLPDRDLSLIVRATP